MTREDHKSGTDRIEEEVEKVGGNADVIINVQGDEPMIDGEGLRRVADIFADSSVEMATLSFPLRKEDENNPNAVKLVTDAKGDALYFSRSLLPLP